MAGPGSGPGATVSQLCDPDAVFNFLACKMGIIILSSSSSPREDSTSGWSEECSARGKNPKTSVTSEAAETGLENTLAMMYAHRGVTDH